MNTYQTDNMDQILSMDTNNKELSSLEESLMQQIVDMKVEINANKSAQYLLVNENQTALIKNDDRDINGMGELNKEALSLSGNEVTGKLSADELLADSVKNTAYANGVVDMDDTYESHFSPYEDLYSYSSIDVKF